MDRAPNIQAATAYDNFYFEAEKQTEYVKVWALVAQIKIVKIHQDQQGNNIHTLCQHRAGPPQLS